MMASAGTETAPLVTKPVANNPSSSCVNNVSVVLCLLAGCIFLSYEMIGAAPKRNQFIQRDDSDTDSSEDSEIERVLFTNNPYDDYLCDADLIYEQLNNDPNTYQFSCAMISSFGSSTNTSLECPDGYILDCLVSASYGRTAGSCEELIDSPDGCGVSMGTVCEDDSIVCDSDDVFEECVNSETDSTVLASSTCDCMPMCVCGLDEPQFYNVADCFGDTTSTVCSGKSGDYDPQNIYVPDTVWNADCKGKNQCELILSNVGEYESNVYQCWNEEFSFENVYYSAINGVEFDGFEEVVVGEMLETCAYMDLKVLAVCKSG